jgi:shikimate 5-dehydrogenase
LSKTATGSGLLKIEQTVMVLPGSEFTLRTEIYQEIDPSHFEESLNDKVALVTGSGRGIGREIALALARCGAAVAITGRTASEVEQTRQDVEAFGVKSLGLVADGRKSADLVRLVKEVR